MSENIISFSKLPLWQGVQLVPGNFSAFPFVLEWEKCGFVKQVSDDSQKKHIITQYSQSDYNFITAPPGASVWANSLGDKELQFILQSCSSFSEKRVLEIGAGSIYLGEKLLEHGVVKYVIMDPAVKEKPKDARIEVVNQYFSKDLCANQMYDVVLCINCLEHLEDPMGFLADLRWLLNKSKGYAVLSFPDNAIQFANGDLNALMHEHISYFTVSTAQRLVLNSGLQIFAKESNRDCIRFLVGVQEDFSLCFPEQMDEEYLRVSSVFQNSINRLKHYICGAMGRGETIAIHGATNGANSALFLAEAGQYEHVWVFDGDETKTGKFLPLCMNPIKHSGSAEYKKVSIVYVAALTYYDEIKKELIQKHHFSENQIVPLFSGTE